MDGDSDGWDETVGAGDLDGGALGAGDVEGAFDGETDGVVVGAGEMVGANVGATVGECVGQLVGSSVGLGVSVGIADCVGIDVGAIDCDGGVVDCSRGDGDGGAVDGSCVGDGVTNMICIGIKVPVVSDWQLDDSTWREKRSTKHCRGQSGSDPPITLRLRMASVLCGCLLYRSFWLVAENGIVPSPLCIDRSSAPFLNEASNWAFGTVRAKEMRRRKRDGPNVQVGFQPRVQNTLFNKKWSC